jgi:hypothetical protein
MTAIAATQAPRWIQDGPDWHLVIGNRSVARIVPNPPEDWWPKHWPQYQWLSLLDYKEFGADGWHAVDFETLEMAQYDIEQWWLHMCRGESYRP